MLLFTDSWQTMDTAFLLKAKLEAKILLIMIREERHQLHKGMICELCHAFSQKNLQIDQSMKGKINPQVCTLSQVSTAHFQPHVLNCLLETVGVGGIRCFLSPCFLVSEIKADGAWGKNIKHPSNIIHCYCSLRSHSQMSIKN